MALSYVPPGVLPAIEVISTPQAPNVTSQVVPIIIGEASGYQTFSENIQLSGTTAVNFSKKGIDVSTNGTALYNLAVTGTNPVTFESVSPANYIVELVSSGTATGDEQYSVKRASIPGTPTLTPGTAGSAAVPAGTYRYAVSYLVNIETGGGTTIYETGIGSYGTVNVVAGTAAESVGGTVVISGMGNSSPSDIAAIGKNIYRSVNLGTDSNPNWGPYYKVTSGTAASAAIGDDEYTDSEIDVTANSNALDPIESGDTITFQYNYTDVNYWEPTLFSDFNDVVEKYGDAFTATGEINSEASFAAKLAILNGAGTVVVAPIPANGESNNTNWEDALLRLEEDQDGNVIVPLTGRTAVHSLVSAHITKLKQRNVWKTAVLGMDGSSNSVSADTLRATAESYANSDLALISPTIFNYYNSYLGTEVPIGGQYVAACLAGMHASRPLSESLTRKQIAGISSVGEKRTTVGKNQDGQAGLTVVEQIPSTGSIRIRHEITTDPSDINTREYPVILQRNNMVNIVAQELDNQVVGKILADTSAPSKVSLVVSQILDNLVNTRNLGDYQAVTARFSTNDPTVISVRWEYRPFYTINYVQISFGINLTTGGITTGNINLIL